MKLNKSREHLRLKCFEIAVKARKTQKKFKLQNVFTNDQTLQLRGTKTKAIHWFPFLRIDSHPSEFCYSTFALQWKINPEYLYCPPSSFK